MLVGALALLALNDHVLKTASPGWVTGKVSDFAGLAVAPALLVAVAEIATRRRLSDGWLLGALFVTGAVFSATKVWVPAGDAYEVVFGLARWPLDSAVAALGGYRPTAPAPVVLTRDPTDLLALPALAVAWVTRPAARTHLRESKAVVGNEVSFGTSRNSGVATGL